MRTIDCTLVGTAPLLCGRPADPPPPPDAEPRVVAAARLYTDDDGQPVIPAANLFSCLIGAAQFVEVDRRTAITALVIDAHRVNIVSPDPWQVDARSVRNRGSRDRSICYRPRFDTWRLTFRLQVDDELLDLQSVRKLLDLAGRRIGLGDFRAERGGPFGRFRLERWEVR